MEGVEENGMKILAKNKGDLVKITYCGKNRKKSILGLCIAIENVKTNKYEFFYNKRGMFYKENSKK
jgi:hypothetical protein